jgi:branched-subunit amino acid aminotransferase/4-amino-4-deoxychorismate lyase
MTTLWCNGQWLDSLDFPASPTDRGLMHGLGLFETILAVDGAPVFAERHHGRLTEGCRRLGWDPGLPDLRETIVELIRANELGNGRARIRLAVTAGSGRVQDLSLGLDHVVWMTAAAVVDPPRTTTANLAPWTRNERSALAGLKAASYAENLIALEHADRLGFEETIFLNTSGHVCEAATANVFVVRDGCVRTPPLDSGCLPGITRSVVIELAAHHGIPCEEAALTSADLELADEIFLTSSIRGVMGLTRFEARILQPGPVTDTLRRAWNTAALEKGGT